MRKYAPYILILIILIGLFSPMVQVSAQPAPLGPPAPTAEQQAALDKATKSSGNALYDSLSNCPPVDGCIAVILYWLFYYIPSFLLGVIANFFDVIIALTIQSTLYAQATFVGNAWAVVRDFSNIFFILVLLYVAIQTILGLGHETKKIIVKVVIMALLINFSMFFTKIVIDSSNILALVFYNKLNVTVVKDGKTTDTNYIPALAGGVDKDVAGKMMAYFDPTKVLSEEFFDKFRQNTYTFSLKGAALAAGGGALVGSWIPILGTGVGAVVGVVGYSLSGFGNSIPLSISAGFIIISGLIIIFAAYAFFIAGLSFLSRMIELWILIIFSPFAFMSSIIPKLSDMEYIGWEAWLKRLLKVSFMAPIFMFFLYLIFMVIQSNIFSSLVARSDLKQGWMETIIFMIIPALIILILLYKATKFAKEGSGQLGEMMMKGLKVAGGLALGAATGGSAIAARATIGRAGAAAAGSKWARKWEASGFGGEAGMSVFKKIGGGSFDIRGAKIGGKTLASATGMNLGETQKGGFVERREADIKKRQKRAQEIEVGEDEPLKQALNTMETDLQKVLNQNVKAIEKFDHDIKDAKEINDPVGIKNAIDAKKAFVNALPVNTIDSTGKAITTTAGTAKHNIADQKAEIIQESRKRKMDYANKLQGKWNRGLNFVLSGGQYALHRGANEAAHKIIMEAKIESSDGGGGGHTPTPAPTPRAAPGGGPVTGGSGGHGGGGHP